MAVSLGVALGLLVATYVFLRVLLQQTQDPKEPPAILTEIPFFGPLSGMLREKARFYIRLRYVYSPSALPSDSIGQEAAHRAY